MTSKGLLRNPGNHVFGGKIKIIAFLTGFEKSAIKPRVAQHNRYFTLFFFCIHDFVLKILQMPKLEPKSNVFMLPSAFDQFFFSEHRDIHKIFTSYHSMNTVNCKQHSDAQTSGASSTHRNTGTKISLPAQPKAEHL